MSGTYSARWPDPAPAEGAAPAEGSGEGEESAVAITKLDEREFRQAIDAMVTAGVDAQRAEENLRKITDVILAQTYAQIDGYLHVAQEPDKGDEPKESAEVYSQLVKSNPLDDPRQAVAHRGVESVNAKPAAKAEDNDESDSETADSETADSETADSEPGSSSS